MLGLRKQESLKFENFFHEVQKAAKERGKAFFCDAADGHYFETDRYEYWSLMGWLIDEADIEDFEPFWKADLPIPDQWDDCFCWAEWQLNEGQLTIDFIFYDENGNQLD